MGPGIHSKGMIRIRCPGFPSLSLPAEDATLAKIQDLISHEWHVPPAEQRLVCGGQVVTESFVPQPGCTLYLSKPKSQTAKPKTPRPTTNLGMPDELLSALASSPGVLQDAFLHNPQIKRMAEKNPEFRQALSDPDTVAQMIKASVDPRAQAELQRGQDRMMSNLEMIPEGFQHLRRWHEQVDAMSQEAADSEQAKLTVLSESVPNRDLRKEALPNPWAAKRKGLAGLDGDFMQKLDHLLSIMGEREEDESASDKEEAFDWDRMRRTLQQQTPASPPPSLLSPPIINPDNKSELMARFSAELTMMREMGFGDEEENLRVLLMTGGNVPSAIDQLVRRMHQ